MSIKTFHLPILIFGLTMAIASCSDDDDDDAVAVEQPTKETAKETKASIELEEDVIVLNEGQTAQIEATVTGGGSLEFETGNRKIAIVTDDGLVRAVACGTTEITVTSGNLEETVTVKVNPVKYDGYTLVWHDEFNGKTLDESTWNIETGGNGWGNQEKQYYTDREDNIKVKDGNLIITVRKESYEGNNYTSGRITTKDKQDFTFGRIEARIDLPEGGGTWPAFWMLGYGSWPRCGEIDIMEHVGNRPNMVSFALHTTNTNGNKGNQWTNQPTVSGIEDGYHIFGIDWTEKYEVSTGIYRQAINFMVDGEVLATQIQGSATEDMSSWPFYKPFYIILNCAMGGLMGGQINDNIFNNQDEEPVQMLVDWVRVYQKD